MRATAFCSLVCFLAWSGASAQSAPQALPPFSVERLELDNSARGSLTLASGLAMSKRQYRVFGALGYQHNPLLLTVDGVTTAPLIGDRLTVHLGGAYAIFDGLEVGLQIPVVVFQGGADLSSLGLINPDAFGFGAPVVGARWAFLRRAAGMPLDVAVDLAVPIPVGSDPALANDPGFGLLPRVSAGYEFSAVRLSAEVGVRVRPEKKIGAATLGTELVWGLGAAISPIEALRLEVAAKSNVSFYGVPAGVELLGGGRLTIGALELFLLGGPGFGTAPGTPAFRLLLGAAAASTIKPKPEVKPEPKPEPKPVEVAKAEPCVEGQGYSIAQCPELDADRDGVKNGADSCPTEPEDKDNFKDEDGCPEPDNDADGIPDEADKCPDEAGPAARQGCPVRDADQDGVEDSADECPKEPGVPEFRGCAPRDQDKDGVLDNVDNCPTEAGPADNQGCPKKVKQLVIITREKLVIKDKVYFDVAKATIQKRSNLLLDQIAQVLLAHPEIKQVSIEGHTDSSGSADTNRKLSQARADSVRDHLMKKGITPDRLKATGFGPDRPAMPNDTPAGREANRRVEFLIQDQPAGESPPPADDELAPLTPSATEKKDGGAK